MTDNIAYTSPASIRRMHSGLIRNICITSLFLFCFPYIRVLSQEIPEYDEIAVFLDVPRVGGGEIDAVIKGEELYLPVTDLFDFLKIRNVPSQGLESISGFFINPEATYTIDRLENQIRYQDKSFNLDPGDLIRTESNLYLKSTYYGTVFGLECNFNFRSLSVKVNTKLELPLIREMRQEEMRRNLTRLKGEVKADTAISRSYPLFKFGMADWSAIATEEINGRSETRLNLTLGSMIAGGEATASLNYNSTQPFTEKQQYYRWRYVNNEFSPLRQVVAGKIASHSISTIYNPVIGVQFTNTPTTYRRSFGSYTLSDRTEPGWIVELYVNNVMVDYVKADASGFFTFEVPLVYGNSIVNLKFYGPWGEERTREQNITIPFNFLPKGTMEYTVSGGIVEDSLRSRFSQASINYGISRSLTVGGGVEYLSSVISGPAMPFLNGSLRITNNLLLSGQYTYGVRTKGTLTYRLPSNLQFDLNYTWYDKDQEAINFNYREERRAVVSTPLRIGKFSSYQRFTLYQLVLPTSRYTTGEWMFSGSFFGINSNLTTYALFIAQRKPYMYGNLSLAIRLPAGIVLMPQAQYGYTENELISAKLRLEKHLLEHAYLNLSYEQNFKSDLKVAEIGFRYDFSFAQTGLSVRQSDKKTTLVQYARGSLINDSKTKYLGSDNRTNVGKGGITVVPYLDLNSNGKKDQGEPRVSGLNLHANGGRVEKDDRDTTIRILGLEPYTSCFIELDPNSFDNIAWRLPKLTLSVTVDPNILKLIEIPVSVAGEATGMVSLEKDGEKRGIGRIILNFATVNHKTVGRTLTENDGYFSYFGLAPGKYYVKVDTAQINKLGLISDPDSLQFSIAGGIDGDFVDGLDFTLRLRPGDTTYIPQAAVIRKDTSYMIIHEVTQELVTITKDSYAIQFGAFRVKSNAEAMRDKLQPLLGKNVEIIIEDNFYKVRIIDIEDRMEVDDKIAILQKNGISEVWVISLKAKQRQLIITDKQDTVRTITETFVEKAAPIIGSEITVQLGAFRDMSNAMGIFKLFRARYGNKVKMVFEDNLYKIRLAGSPLIKQSVLEEMGKLGPSLGKLKFDDIWVVPPVTPLEEEPAVMKPESLPGPVEWNREVPAIIKSDTIERLIKEKLVAPPIHTEPTVSLQVAVYHSRYQALRAQRKITSKLKLPVKIVKQWDYYRVIVTGFYTREETYKYYPELAGLGFPGILLIEEK
jgi:hypothetical protein